MEPRPLTTWEQKERDGLLALETDEWRQKRLIAEDPNTTAQTLEEFRRLISAVRKNTETRLANRRVGLLEEAMAANPNTPPSLLVYLLNGGYMPLTFSAFFRNPVTPLLVLELPDFWQRFCSPYNETQCQELLREESLPLVAVRAFTEHSYERISRAAPLHTAFAGEIQVDTEGITGIRASEYAKYERDFHIHIYELYLRDMAFLRAEGYAYQLRMKGTSPDWIERMYTVFQLPLTAEPFFEGDESAADWNRSPLDLLHHLTHDGNRLVRWAAQTRLADPDFVFTWSER